MFSFVSPGPKDSAMYFTGACPVQFFAEDKRSLPRRSGRSYWGEFNRGGSKNKNETRKINPAPLFIDNYEEIWDILEKRS